MNKGGGEERGREAMELRRVLSYNRTNGKKRLVDLLEGMVWGDMEV